MFLWLRDFVEIYAIEYYGSLQSSVSPPPLSVQTWHTHALIKRNPKNMQKAKNFNKQQISEEVDESSAPTSLIFVVCRLLFRC